jgi:glucokinase
MAGPTRPRLIADIGGTNARFALADTAGIGEVAVLPVAGHADFVPALDAYLAGRAGTVVGEVAIAAAGPRDGDSIMLTNAPWRIEGGAVSRRLGGVPVRVLNDLEAVAIGLPALGARDIEVLAAGAPGPGPLPMLAANVGTGFGAAVAVPTRTGGSTGWTALGTEAGHMSLVPADADEAALIERILLEGAQTIEVEDAFSGPGYARLFGVAMQDGGETVSPVDAHAQSRERAAYSRMFGRVLGDLALATGAWGGVFLTGGVMSDLPRVMDVPSVLAAFLDKGKMAARMQRVPFCRIAAPSPAFQALATVEIG